MMSYGSQAERAWHLDETAAEPIVKAAVDGGIAFFDTADTYSDGVSEQITGRLLGRLFGRREDYVLTEEEIRRLEEPYVPHPVLGHA